MSLINERQDFSDIADTFLLHGSMQSPAFLDGRLCASLALHDLSAEGWLEVVCQNLSVEQPRDEPSAERLLGWRRQTVEALSASEMNYEPLLPDDLFSLGERAQGLKDWTLGFLEVIEDAGDAPRKAWSEPLRGRSTTSRAWPPSTPTSMTTRRTRTTSSPSPSTPAWPP